MNAVIVGDYTENYAYVRAIVHLVAQARLPMAASSKEFVTAGGLMSYGPFIDDRVRQAADYVDRILRGANPGDLPYQQSTKFEFAINLKTAKSLGLTIPPPLRLRADHVIE